MRAGVAFASELAGSPRANEVRHITVDLFGSLGATGRGHSTDRAVLLGLGGHAPESVSIPEVESLLPTLASSGRLPVAGIGQVPFDMAKDMRFVPRTVLPYHVNALTITACDAAGETLLRRTYYSIGGGFVMEQTNDDPQAPQVRPLDRVKEDASPLALPHPFGKAMELLSACDRSGLSIAQLVYENEVAMRAEEEVDAYLDLVANTMFDCIDAGLQEHGILPGGLNVLRRAGTLAKRLRERETCQPRELPDSMEWAATYADPMRAMDWVNLYALAVNEENAAGHRVVTAPTNGAAGVIPAVIGFLTCYCPEAGVPFGMFTPLDQGGHFPFRLSPADREGNSAKRRQAVHRFLLAAAAVGSLIKTNASIAGAEVGCQGEVGSASAMAAAGLAQALGGTPRQVENAAEIAMEHSLGLTCDPVAGLVQIPCIERNAIAASKAINAARMAMWGGRTPHCEPGCRDRDDAPDRQGHALEVQGDLGGRTGRQRCGVLKRTLPGHVQRSGGQLSWNMWPWVDDRAHDACTIRLSRDEGPGSLLGWAHAPRVCVVPGRRRNRLWSQPVPARCQRVDHRDRAGGAPDQCRPPAGCPLPWY